MIKQVITVNGPKRGELIYFTINLPKVNFFTVMDMVFNSVEDVLNGEKNGLYTVEK